MKKYIQELKKTLALLLAFVFVFGFMPLQVQAEPAAPDPQRLTPPVLDPDAATAWRTAITLSPPPASAQDPDATVQYRIGRHDTGGPGSVQVAIWHGSPMFASLWGPPGAGSPTAALAHATYFYFQARFISSDPDLWLDSEPSAIIRVRTLDPYQLSPPLELRPLYTATYNEIRIDRDSVDSSLDLPTATRQWRIRPVTDGLWQLDDNTGWFSNGIFSGLQPLTYYYVQARYTGLQGWLPSEPSNHIIIRTPDIPKYDVIVLPVQDSGHYRFFEYELLVNGVIIDHTEPDEVFDSNLGQAHLYEGIAFVGDVVTIRVKEDSIGYDSGLVSVTGRFYNRTGNNLTNNAAAGWQNTPTRQDSGISPFRGGSYSLTMRRSAANITNSANVFLNVAVHRLITNINFGDDGTGDGRFPGGEVSAIVTAMTAANNTITVTAVPDAGFYLHSMEFSANNGASWTPITTVTGFNTRAFNAPGASESVRIRASFAHTGIYPISTQNQLFDFAERVNNGEDFHGTVVRLENSIEITRPWVPVGVRNIGGNVRRPFSGTFDGNGHTIIIRDGIIRNPLESVAREYNLALFGFVQGGTIQNLTVRGTLNFDAGDVMGGHNITAAGIAAHAVGGSLIKNCVSYVNIYVTAQRNFSGHSVGGIVNSLTASVVRYSVNHGTLGGALISGGIVNSMVNSTVSGCVNFGSVSTREGSAAGIANRVSVGGSSVIEDSANKGFIRAFHPGLQDRDPPILTQRGSRTAAGIITHVSAPANITNSYNTGAIYSHGRGQGGGDGHPRSSGIVGFPNALTLITNSYNVGELTQRAGIRGSGRLPTDDIVLRNTLGDFGTGIVPIDPNLFEIVNCLTRDEIMAMSSQEAAAALNRDWTPAPFVADTAGVNPHNAPLLAWESPVQAVIHQTVTFNVLGQAEYAVTVWSNEAGTDEYIIAPIIPGGSMFALSAGNYWYRVNPVGFDNVYGTFVVTDGSVVITVPIEGAMQSATPTAAVAAVTKPSPVSAFVTFMLTSRHSPATIWNVYGSGTATAPHPTVTASFSGGILTLTYSGSDIAETTFYVTATEPGLTESERLALTVGAYVEQSATPAAANTTVTKTAQRQRAVQFTLTSQHNAAATWQVYLSDYDTEVFDGVTASRSNGILTLTAAGNDIAATTYFVSVTEPGMGESDRLALTIVAYDCGTVWDGSRDIGWYNTNQNTFTLTTAAQLAGLAQLVNSGNSFRGKTVNLGADIDLGGIEVAPGGLSNDGIYWTQPRWAGQEWVPIGHPTPGRIPGTINNPGFEGTFDGRHHLISNMYIPRLTHHPVTGVELSGDNNGANNQMGLIGQLAGPGIVRNVVIFSGFVHGERHLGGVVGRIDNGTGGHVENSANFATVYGVGQQGHGGIVGANFGGRPIRNTFNAGTIVTRKAFSSHHWSAGGIVGCNQGAVYNSFNIGRGKRVVGHAVYDWWGGVIYDWMGGIAGPRNAGRIVNSHSLTGDIDGIRFPGELSTHDSAVITNSYLFTNPALMQTQDFVDRLNGGSPGSGAFRMDTYNMNNGFPVLAGSERIPVPPTITTEALPNGAVGIAYSQTLAATGTDPIAWSVYNGTLPPGLTLSGNTISGTPEAAGTHTFTVRAENNTGYDTQSLSITISAAGADTITAGGTYYLADFAGMITIATTEPVTLVGRGTANADRFSGLHINATQGNANLTLRDVFIDNSGATVNTINFEGMGNTLTLEGASLVEHRGNNPAAIRVPQGAELAIGGAGTLYMFRDGFGAGIGGDNGESGGHITFDSGNIFIKAHRVGAAVGAGQNADSGPVTINGGMISLMSTARGAAIGGSNLTGNIGDITINGGTLLLAIDFTGSAIGPGGGGTSPAAPRGNLIVNGGSVKTVVLANAANAWGLPAGVDAISDAGINTASRRNAAGQNVYLLRFDTSLLSETHNSFAVQVNGQAFYTGPGHIWDFYNTVAIMDNWIPGSDKYLYLFVPAENHTLDVNGETFTARWDEVSEEFIITVTGFGPVPQTGIPDITVAMVAMFAFFAAAAVFWGVVLRRKTRRSNG